jgi:hypothetical protein
MPEKPNFEPQAKSEEAKVQAPKAVRRPKKVTRELSDGELFLEAMQKPTDTESAQKLSFWRNQASRWR